MGSNRAHTLLLVFFVTVTILILSTNYAFAADPTVDAGTHADVTEGDTISLDATAGDTDGDSITYSWTLKTGPSTSDPFAIGGGPFSADNTAEDPTWKAAQVSGDQVLVFELTVTAGGASVSDTVTFTVKDSAGAAKFAVMTPAFDSLLDKVSFSQNLGAIMGASTYAIQIGTNGAQSNPSAQLKQLVLFSNVAGSDVTLDFEQFPNVPSGVTLPDIVTALFLDFTFSGGIFSSESDFTIKPIIQFTIKNNFVSESGNFVDGCPVMLFQTLEAGSWADVDPASSIANKNKIYVTNSDGTLSVIDGTTNNLEATIPVGSTPKQVGFDQTTNTVYVVNEGSNTVSVIDGSDNSVTATIDVGSSPFGVAVDSSNNRLYVTNPGDGNVTVIDTTNNLFIANITSFNGPTGIAVNSTGYIFVANKTGNTVSIINGGNFLENVTLAVTKPFGVVVDSSNNRAYVTSQTGGASGLVVVINTDDGSAVTTISVGKEPTGLSLNPTTKKLYVANSGNPSTISIIDTVQNVVLKTVTMGLSGAVDVEVNPNTHRIFVVDGAGTVSVIDGIPGSVDEDKVIDTITGFTGNDGIALNTAIPNPVRDPSADDGDMCAYIASPNHFSKFAIGGIKALFLAGLTGGGGDRSVPTFGDASLASFGTGSDGFGVILSDTNQNILEDIVSLATNEKNVFRFDLTQSQGINSLEHVAFYFNLRGDEFKVEDSDTYIVFDKGKPLLVVDPNGYFSEVDFKILEKDATHLVLKYEITFAVPMEETQLLVRTWDLKKATADKLLPGILVEHQNPTTTDASEVLSGESELQETQISAEVSESLDEARMKLNEAKTIPTWIKTSAGWWSEKKISDSDFVLGVEFLIKNGVITVPQTESVINSSPQIPDWISVNAGWWANEQISDEEFTQTLQWLIANGVMRI